jgi:hypothetical protein
MSGYSKQRFVGLAENEDEELTCGICLGILNKPMVVRCCSQTFCEYCINEWLKNDETCPHDRQNLTKYELIKPPRIVQNLLSKLRIHCKHQNSGCDSIIKLENLDNHELNCKFNPVKFCEKCNFIINSDEEHDCITNLVAKNLSLLHERRLKGGDSIKKAKTIKASI